MDFGQRSLEKMAIDDCPEENDDALTWSRKVTAHDPNGLARAVMVRVSWKLKVLNNRATASFSTSGRLHLISVKSRREEGKTSFVAGL